MQSPLLLVLLALALCFVLIAFFWALVKRSERSEGAPVITFSFPSPFDEGGGVAEDSKKRASNTTESSGLLGNRRYESLLAMGMNASFQAVNDKALQFMLAVHPSRTGLDSLLPHERMLMLHALNTAQVGNTNTLAWLDALDPVAQDADFLDIAGGEIPDPVSGQAMQANAWRGVCAALDSVLGPDWAMRDTTKTAHQLAVEAIRRLGDERLTGERLQTIAFMVCGCAGAVMETSTNQAITDAAARLMSFVAVANHVTGDEGDRRMEEAIDWLISRHEEG